jgi:hypothetical protein
MSRVLKLIQAAQQIATPPKYMIPSFIFRAEDGSGDWIASARFWSGRPGEPLDIHKSRHKTIDEAQAAIEQLAKQFPPEDAAPIIMVYRP